MSMIGGTDWSDAPEPVSLQAGEYEVRVSGAILVENRNVDKDTGEKGHHVKVTYTIMNAEEPDFNGKDLTDRFSTKQSARFMFVRMLACCGITPDDLETYDDLIGSELKVQVALKKRNAREGEDPENIRAWPEVVRTMPLA